MLLAVLFDQAAQVVGVKLIGQCDRGKRRARLQACSDHLRLEFGRVFAASSASLCLY